MSHPSLFSRRALAAATSITIVIGGAATVAPAAIAQQTQTTVPAADPATVVTTDLNWGFKESWRSYLASSWTKGTTQASAGASVNEDGNFSFPQSAESTYDPAGGKGEIRFGGRITFASELHGFSIVLENPTIRIGEDGQTGVLSADLSELADPGQEGISRVDVASLVLPTPDVSEQEGEKTYTWTAVEGVFLDTLQPKELNRYAKQSSDPLSFAVTVKDAPTNPGGETPTNPGGETPTNPGGETPTNPGGKSGFFSRILDLLRQLTASVGGWITSS
ncbi:HtaA domain-containing protein [Corynebacterium pacaense]|uniref:HtaA domain-containing protein n=1 Tax=Corynebacterium pacaense TaxID=1816684 RepID=UPI0015C48A3B|nr:HtaA domain-containing protein [Corynebacterium pacaense]